MAKLKDISGGQVSGTDTITCKGRICGGLAIVADGTNTGTVVLKNDNASGNVVLQFSTSTPVTIFAPFDCNENLYYSITGTGCTAQIFEWLRAQS